MIMSCQAPGLPLLGDEPEVMGQVIACALQHPGDGPRASFVHESRPCPCLRRQGLQNAGDLPARKVDESQFFDVVALVIYDRAAQHSFGNNPFERGWAAEAVVV